MAETSTPPADRVRPLVRVRQFREFTTEGLGPGDLEAITDAARWSGSSRNSQPWRFIVITEPQTVSRIALAGLPQTRSLPTAQAAIAIALPDDPGAVTSLTYDDGIAGPRSARACRAPEDARAAAARWSPPAQGPPTSSSG